MPVIRIESLADARVADYHALTDAALLRRRRQFVAEGRLVVERAVASGAWRIHSMLLSDTALTAMRATAERLPDVPIYVCAGGAFAQLSGVNFHRGCLALVERPPDRPVRDVVEAAATVVVLEGIGNADNMGGIFRNAAAFGADAVLLAPGCVDPLYRKAVRTSMAAVLGVPFAWLSAWPGELDELRARDFTVVALTPGEPARTLDDVAAAGRPGRLALLLGAEGPGLSQVVLDRADLRVRIPTTTAVDSLNVVVACGIALSRLGR